MKQLFSLLYYTLAIKLLTSVVGCSCNDHRIDNKPNIPPTKKIVELPPVKNKGIPNIGNSCYMNAGIQALASFYGKLIEYRASQNPNDQVAVTLNELIKSITIQQGGPGPTEIEAKAKAFYKALELSETNGGIGWVNKGGKQEDADELLTKLFAHFDLPKFRIQPKLINNITKEDRFSTEEVFNKLELPISEDTIRTMQDAVNEFFSPGLIADFKWDEKKVTPTQKIPILQDLDKLYNNMLIVSLKRYGLNACGNAIKIDRPIQEPFHITLAQEQTLGNKKKVSYDLVGFLLHSGSTGGGHYVAYVKVNGIWVIYNDSSVREATAIEAEKAAEQAYIFFYHKVK
jgi:uncharacterized UBP type Zn finger protein